MTVTSSPAVDRGERPHLTVGGRTVGVVLPNRHDPRLKVSAVIMTVQVLGQTVLGFKVSIAQILISIGFCALVEVVVTLRREHLLVWPASAILTGNGVALILRASGTRHGDWWSLHGIQYFLIAGSLSLLSKYLIRSNGRHLFNPSNVGIVWCLLVIGPARVFPQYLWWGPFRGPVIAALVIIGLGGVWVLRQVRMVPMAASFISVYAVLIGLQAVAGRSFSATWHNGPVTGAAFFFDICASPELFVFVFFMVSDPQTTPRTTSGRALFGGLAAVIAGGLAAIEPTEFGIKLALLSSLTVACALVPLVERLTAGGVPHERPPSRSGTLVAAARNPALIAALVIAVAAPIDTAALSRNKQLINIERRLTGARNAQ